MLGSTVYEDDRILVLHLREQNNQLKQTLNYISLILFLYLLPIKTLTYNGHAANYLLKVLHELAGSDMLTDVGKEK